MVVHLKMIVIYASIFQKFSINTYKCPDCDKGKYINKPGADECNPCQSNKYTNFNGSIMCNDCPKNSEPNFDKTKCECITNTYMTNSDPIDLSNMPRKFYL